MDWVLDSNVDDFKLLQNFTQDFKNYVIESNDD